MEMTIASCTIPPAQSPPAVLQNNRKALSPKTTSSESGLLPIRFDGIDGTGLSIAVLHNRYVVNSCCFTWYVLVKYRPCLHFLT